MNQSKENVHVNDGMSIHCSKSGVNSFPRVSSSNEPGLTNACGSSPMQCDTPTSAPGSQSTFFQSKSVCSTAQFGNQDPNSRSFGQASNASTVRPTNEGATQVQQPGSVPNLPTRRRNQYTFSQSKSVCPTEHFGNHGRSFGQESNASITRFMILKLQDEARSLYNSNNYKGASLKLTEAIAQFKGHPRDSPDKFLRSMLFENRAACLMRVGAFQVAIEDCKQGLTIMPTLEEAASLDDFNPTFKANLLCLMARASIHLGYADQAMTLFNLANESIQEMFTFFSKNLISNPVNDATEAYLTKVRNDVANGKMDIRKFREAIHRISKTKNGTFAESEKPSIAVDYLADIDLALSLATDCDELHQEKVSTLGNLGRWREVEGYCERLAASRTKLDGVFVEDLASRCPFPGVAPAVSLRADYFQDAFNDMREAKKKLCPKSVAEAVLRLPYPIIPYYARSLRLEESYNAEECMLDALEAHVTNHSEALGMKDVREELRWLQEEREKLLHTKEERLRADDLFGSGAYAEAAARYEYCLDIDSNGAPSPLGAKTAGGRLHAILHCNRAACYMALKRYHEAVTECTSALSINEWYMKAMIRRARCYGHLNRHDESIAEYKRYIDIVNRARSQTLHFSPSLFPCIFEGPEEVTKKDLETAEEELQKAIEAKENEKFQQNSARSADPGRFGEYFSSQSDGSRGPKGSHSKPRPKTSSQDNDPNRYSYKESNSSSSGSDGNNKDSRTMNFTNNSDHYSVLGVSRNATEAQIKKAFRNMALKYHPDKNSDKDAAEIFRRMKEAHEILMDPQSRRDYDFKQFGG